MHKRSVYYKSLPSVLMEMSWFLTLLIDFTTILQVRDYFLLIYRHDCHPSALILGNHHLACCRRAQRRALFTPVAHVLSPTQLHCERKNPGIVSPRAAMVVTLVLQTHHGDSDCRACMSTFYCHVGKKVGLLGAEAVSLNSGMTDGQKHSPSMLSPSPVMSKKSSSEAVIL